MVIHIKPLRGFINGDKTFIKPFFKVKPSKLVRICLPACVVHGKTFQVKAYLPAGRQACAWSPERLHPEKVNPPCSSDLPAADRQTGG